MSAIVSTNRLMLDATLAQRGDLRFTPAGVPALDCVLKHASMQAEAGGKRAVDCELAAVAFGDPAKALARVPTGTAVRCTGFLARRFRTGVAVALHVNEFETLDHASEGN